MMIKKFKFIYTIENEDHIYKQFINRGLCPLQQIYTVQRKCMNNELFKTRGPFLLLKSTKQTQRL